MESTKDSRIKSGTELQFRLLNLLSPFGDSLGDSYLGDTRPCLSWEQGSRKRSHIKNVHAGYQLAKFTQSCLHDSCRSCGNCTTICRLLRGASLAHKIRSVVISNRDALSDSYHIIMRCIMRPNKSPKQEKKRKRRRRNSKISRDKSVRTPNISRTHQNLRGCLCMLYQEYFLGRILSSIYKAWDTRKIHDSTFQTC